MRRGIRHTVSLPVSLAKLFHFWNQFIHLTKLGVHPEPGPVLALEIQE